MRAVPELLDPDDMALQLARVAGVITRMADRPTVTTMTVLSVGTVGVTLAHTATEADVERVLEALIIDDPAAPEAYPYPTMTLHMVRGESAAAGCQVAVWWSTDEHDPAAPADEPDAEPAPVDEPVVEVVEPTACADDPTDPDGGDVVDLLGALQRSVERARAARRRLHVVRPSSPTDPGWTTSEPVDPDPVNALDPAAPVAPHVDPDTGRWSQ